MDRRGADVGRTKHPMAKTTDRAVLDDWYAIDSSSDVGPQLRRTRLLGAEIELYRAPDGAVIVREVGAANLALPVRERHGCVWTTLGTPAKDVVEIAEAAEPDRRFVLCGWVTVRTSGLRVIENFLDMAHFPFVHTGILGAEPDTEVPPYRSEIRRDVDEVWATGCTFFQPRIAVTENHGGFVHLTFRAPSPFVVMLYRVCPTAPDRLDAIALFVQPLEPDLCRAQPVMYLVDPVSAHVDLQRFEQIIFLQDRIILENQRPRLLPLVSRTEIPADADIGSLTYRRWLREKGVQFGTTGGSVHGPG
jgi:phenylpropionate dioxygenase-like ring-hydroxylating dioxygenase large terminal subunit